MAGVDNEAWRSLLWWNSGEQEMGNNCSTLHVQVTTISFAVQNKFSFVRVHCPMKCSLKVFTIL